METIVTETDVYKYKSGFSSQGDGACFVGKYSYRKNGLKELKEYAPVDTELHSIGESLQAIQKRHFYNVEATVKHSGHYYHRFCTDISVYRYDHQSGDETNFNESEEVIDLLRDFMLWIYNKLEEQYWYLVSEEAIIETIRSNDYDFTIDGKLYRR